VSRRQGRAPYWVRIRGAKLREIYIAGRDKHGADKRTEV
jgi:hypothetical protein